MATKLEDIDLSDLMRGVEITGITFGRGGHQIRTAITGGRRHATFMYPSKRYSRGQSGDGWTELNVHKISEVTPHRLDFLPQPCRIEAEVHGRPACAFPDFAYVDMHSRPVLAEAKMHWADFERPKALLQQAITRKGAEALGWGYEQITSTSIGSTGFLAAVDQVQAFRFANVPLRIELAVAQTVRKAGGVRIGDLSNVLDEGVGRCIAFACALMVRRVVAVDLDAPISELSVVRPAPKRPIAYPRIRL